MDFSIMGFFPSLWTTNFFYLYFLYFAGGSCFFSNLEGSHAEFTWLCMFCLLCVQNDQGMVKTFFDGRMRIFWMPFVCALIYACQCGNNIYLMWYSVSIVFLPRNKIEMNSKKNPHCSLILMFFRAMCVCWGVEDKFYLKVH